MDILEVIKVYGKILSGPPVRHGDALDIPSPIQTVRPRSDVHHQLQGLNDKQRIPQHLCVGKFQQGTRPFRHVFGHDVGDHGMDISDGQIVNDEARD
jgi:hypothetical protein